MELSGKIKVSARVGRPVVIDEWSFPRSVTLTFEGEGRSPDLVARFEIRDERPECVDIRVTAKPDGSPVTDADLRLFSLDNLARRAFASAAGRPLPFGGHALDGFDSSHEDEVDDVLRQAQDVDAQLTRVARVYLNDVHSAPILAVQSYLGQSRRTAARWVKRARDADPPLIPPVDAPAHEYEAARARLEPDDSEQSTMTIEEYERLKGERAAKEDG